MIQVLLACTLDLLVGDPAWSIHPVRLIGKLIEKLELSLRRPKAGNLQNKILGTLLVVLVCALSYGVVHLIMVLAKTIHPWLGLFTAVVVIYSSLAIRDLKRHAKDVSQALADNDLGEARRYVARIVGRDTRNLSEEQVIRASVESIAENTVDGIIAPIFYAFIGGAPLAFLYRAINTMDSMIGYKNSKYRNFGWAAARLDDAFNFIPARINAIFVPLASLIVGRNTRESIAAMITDGHNHPSPNSGISEAAFAGALEVQLGGRCTYEGTPCHKPYLGKAIKPLDISHIYSSITISMASVTLMIFMGSLVFVMIGGLK